MDKHINTITVKRDKMVISGPPPDLFGVDGEVFSNLLPLHFDSDGSKLHLIKIRRVADVFEEPVDDHEHTFDNVPLDYTVFIFDFESGKYEIRYSAYYEEDGVIYSTSEGTAEFAIINRKNTLKKIGVSEVKDTLKDIGFTSSGYDLIDNYLCDQFENTEPAKGVFITFEIESSFDTFHKTTIEFKEKSYKVKYNNSAEGKKGIVFIPTDTDDGITEEIVKIRTEEYMEEECVNLLDITEEEQPLHMLNTYYINLQKQEPFILMSRPKDNVFSQVVNLSFNNINNYDRIAGYRIDVNGELGEVRTLMRDKTSIIFNNPGEYKIVAMVTSSDDTNFLNPILVKEGVFKNLEHAELIFNVPEKVVKTLGFNVQVRNSSNKKIEKVYFTVNRYTDKLEANKINPDFYELHIDTLLPKGDHIIFSEVVFTDGSKEVLTKGFTIETAYTNHIDQIKKTLSNTTFVFSGHNIKSFAALSMESFIINCGIRREQVCYFDDLSTDGTHEEFINRHLSMMSWKKDIYNSFMNSKLSHDLPLRVDQIIQSALQQIETKYVCFLDGDNFYYENAILKLLSMILNEDEDFSVFGFKDIRHAPENDPTYQGIAVRIYQNFLWINLSKFNHNELECTVKDAEDLFDRFEDDIINECFDTGTMLYYKLMEQGVNCVLFKHNGEIYTDLQCIMYHIGWLSSSMRNDSWFAGSWQEQFSSINNFIEKRKNNDLFKKCGISKTELKSDLMKNFKGGLYEVSEQGRT